MCTYIQKYEMDEHIGLFQLNSKRGPVSLKENHLKRMWGQRTQQPQPVAAPGIFLRVFLKKYKLHNL